MNVDFQRSGLREQSADVRLREGRRAVKMLLAGRTASRAFSDGEVPDLLASNDAVERYFEIQPPQVSLFPPFQRIVSEIDVAYVGGLHFAAVAASCVSIERMLNMARIELHHHCPKRKELWGKGPLNLWDGNIDALQAWGYLTPDFAKELAGIQKGIRNEYLHSGEMLDLNGDALRSVRAAYKLIGDFLGFPKDLFQMKEGCFVCLNSDDPRYKAFYLKHLSPE